MSAVCSKPKVASVIVLVTFIVLSDEIYACFMKNVDLYIDCILPCLPLTSSSVFVDP